MATPDGGPRPHGGPAFPTDGQTLMDGTVATRIRAGMSLRDYFAAAVLPAVYAHAMTVGCDSQETIIAEAYELADTMLQERAK